MEKIFSIVIKKNPTKNDNLIKKFKWSLKMKMRKK
jgi:hypothetical protein